MPPADSRPPPPDAARPLGWSLAWLLVTPLLLVGPALLPGHRLLPLHPAGFEPLASERPAAAAAAWERPNYLAADRLFPQLTDQLALRRQALGGTLPTWDPDLGLGTPLLAGTMAGTFYPPNWLQLLLPPDLAAAPLALVALLLAGAGTARLLARHGLSAGACLVGAVAVQAGGWAVANLHDGMKVDAALWLPWQLAAVEAVRARRRHGGFELAVTAALPLLAGFPPVAVFGLVATAACALVRAPRALAFLALGALGGAVQLAPTAVASLESLRGPQGAAEIARQSLPVGTAVSIAVPDFFGAPDEPVFAPHLPAAWWVADADEAEAAMAANPLEWNLFAGAAVLALAAAALATAPRRAAFPALLVVGALAFAQGWPLVRAAYALPGLDLGAPARAAAVAWIGWGWLAGLGAEAARARPRRAALAGVAAAAALAAGGLVLRSAVDPARFPAQLAATLAARHGVGLDEVARWVRPEDAAATARRVASGGARLAAAAACVGVALAAAAALHARGRPRLAWLPLALVVAAQGAVGARAHLAPRDVPGEVFPPSEGMEAVRRAAGNGRVVRLDASPGGVADVERLARPNLPHAYGIADLTPYVVFPPRYAVELLAALDPRARWRTGASRLPDPALLDHPVLDLLRVTAVLARAPLEHPRLEPVLERPGFCVYRRTGALPPARVVPRALPMASDELALGQLRTRTVPPSEATLLAPGFDADAARALPPPAVPATDAGGGAGFRPGTLAVERPSPRRLDVAVRGSSGGWLVVHEGWAPGWRATVDGVEVEVARVDHAFRGVPVPPGDSVVRLRHAPASLPLGAALTAAALAAAFLLDRFVRVR